ncbi:MAG: NYN domain-containing protein, partial [Bacteroidota bacterium]
FFLKSLKIQPHICPKGLFENEMKNLFFILFSKDRECKFISRALLIILSGDSDYVELVRHLRGEGVRVEIAAVLETTAQLLIDEADLFTAITKDDCYLLKKYRKTRKK